MVAVQHIQGTYMKLLHIDSAITGAHSVSRKINAQIVEAYLAQHSNIEVSYLDLAANAPAHHGCYGATHRSDRWAERSTKA